MELNDIILGLMENTPDSIQKNLAKRVKKRRLESALTQASLARKAGIPLATYRLFERTGNISLRGIILAAMALGQVDDFNAILNQPNYSSIASILKEPEVKLRKRGKR